MYKLVIILSFLVHLRFCESAINLGGDDARNILKKSSGFLFSMPKTLVSGKNETVCLSLHKVNVPAKALVDLKWRYQHYPTSRTLDYEHTCFHMYVPLRKILEPQFVSVRVQVQLNGDIHSAHNQDPVLVYPDNLNKIFIETDRTFYKPGDTVKIRILQLNEHFLPVSTKIPEIRIKNPLDISVTVWDNIAPDHGLVSMEYQMVSEAITGKWKIELGSEKKFFEVSKYSTSRFKISLKYPKVIYYKNSSINIDVCAQYSYNKPVRGVAFIQINDSYNNSKAVNKLQEMQNGCTQFKIAENELNLVNINEKFPMYDQKITLHFTATVTEEGTNKMDVAVGKCQVGLKAYVMKFDSNPIFIPGVPYEGKLKITNVHSNIDGEVIEICYNLAIKRSWNYFNNEQCQNYKVNDNRIVDFRLWPLRNNVLHIHMNARSLNNTNIADTFLAARIYSPSSSYIYLESNYTDDKICNTPHQYKVFYTTDHFKEGANVTFYYMIKTNSEIYKLRKIVHAVRKNNNSIINDDKDFLGIKHKFVKLGANIDNFIMKFKIERKMVSKYQLLVYYHTNSGETIAATKTAEVEPCTLKVITHWSQNQILPGETATLNIKTANSVICAVSALDKSSKFISNNHQPLNLERVLKEFSQERESAQSGRNTCISANKKEQGQAASMLHISETEFDNFWDLRKRRKRHIYSFSEDYDSYDIFSKFGIITITNLKLITKPCYSGPLLKDTKQVQFMTDKYDSENEDVSPLTIRSFFPENWLWELVPVSDAVQLMRQLPHSITNWITNVYCLSESEGIGFSTETELSSFQPFFVDVLTMYSVKCGEYFYLPVHVFNYLNYTFPIRITVRPSNNLQLANSQHKLSVSHCLLKNSTTTHSFQLIGTVMGPANVTVLVETDNEYPLPCGPETIIFKRDVVFKSIEIQSEGYPITDTKSALLCDSDIMETSTSNNVTWTLNIPHDIVPKTEKISISISGDLLGQTIENLHQLLSIPTGCGEQIMASMAPNLYALRYLNATGTLTYSIKQRIIRNLKIGYQRILNYLHRDGSFSAFGYHDSSGSMFLTAFVVKVLKKASDLIYVDQRVIDKAINWIFDNQLENGCFNTMLHVFQDMGGTNMENSTAGLTAYVISSLFESEIDIPESVQTNAKYCIRSQHNPDKYSLTISCYALFKVHWISEASRFLERVLAISNREFNMMWWSTKGDDDTYASDIEITSYALLALMQQKTTKNMGYAHAIVQWLTSKIGPTGVFKSTQDSVVALDALARYAQLIHSNTFDLKINVDANEEHHRFSMKQDDRLKSKHINLQNTNNEVKIYVSGKGCALAQATVSYYSTKISKSDAFKLAMDVSSVSNVDECSIRRLSPCIAYDGADKLSNMAVMEISLPSGYEADRSSLYNLVATEKITKIKMFEEKSNQVNLYFAKLDKQEVCFEFNINEHLPLENRKENFIKLYDYYRPEYIIMQFYNITNCSKKYIQPFEDKALPIKYPGTNFTKIEIKPEDLKLEAEVPTTRGEQEEISSNCLQVDNANTDEEEVNYLKFNRDNTSFQSNVKIPECILVPQSTLSLNKNRVKRDQTFAKDRQSTNTSSTLNSSFVDRFTDLDIPNCVNIPFYVRYNCTTSHRRSKRNMWIRFKRDGASTLNKDFVNLDIDMETPNCINIPFYTRIPSSNKNKTQMNSFYRIRRDYKTGA